MTLNFSSLLNEIDIVLDEIEVEYQQVPGLILTEDDLKCMLYKKLTDLPALSNPLASNDELLASVVHAEVSWYDENGRLTLRPDITIIEPENLSITGYRRHFAAHSKKSSNSSHYDYSSRVSKDFVFWGKAILFELKFIRGPLGVHPRIVDKIEADHNKMMRLIEIQEDVNSIFCYQVIFNKTNVKCKSFDDFLTEYGIGNRHKVVYKTGNLILPYKTPYFLK